MRCCARVHSLDTSTGIGVFARSNGGASNGGDDAFVVRCNCVLQLNVARVREAQCDQLPLLGVRQVRLHRAQNSSLTSRHGHVLISSLLRTLKKSFARYTPHMSALHKWRTSFSTAVRKVYFVPPLRRCGLAPLTHCRWDWHAARDKVLATTHSATLEDAKYAGRRVRSRGPYHLPYAGRGVRCLCAQSTRHMIRAHAANAVSRGHAKTHMFTRCLLCCSSPQLHYYYGTKLDLCKPWMLTVHPVSSVHDGQNNTASSISILPRALINATYYPNLHSVYMR